LKEALEGLLMLLCVKAKKHIGYSAARVGCFFVGFSSGRSGGSVAILHNNIMVGKQPVMVGFVCLYYNTLLCNLAWLASSVSFSLMEFKHKSHLHTGLVGRLARWVFV